MNKITIAIITLVIGLVVGIGATHAYHTSNTMTTRQASNSQVQSGMDSMMANLQGKTGDEFDKAFISEMIMHHQGAVVMAESALQNANHQEIKDLAQAIISAQNKEIADMQQWQKNWYGIESTPTSNDNAQPGSMIHNMQ